MLALVPTAAIRSPAIATASAQGCAGFAVQTRALTMASVTGGGADCRLAALAAIMSAAAKRNIRMREHTRESADAEQSTVDLAPSGPAEI
jgi:hypothetical protein